MKTSNKKLAPLILLGLFLIFSARADLIFIPVRAVGNDALPSNIGPEVTPQKNSVELTKNEAIKTSDLWLFYVALPAILAGLWAFIFLRKKKNKKSLGSDLGKGSVQV